MGKNGQNPNCEVDLSRTVAISTEIDALQTRIHDLTEERRVAWERCMRGPRSDRKLRYRQVAEACGVSEDFVYKEVRTVRQRSRKSA